MLNRASNLYINDQTRKYSFKTNKPTNKDNKGYEITGMVVTTTRRGAKRKNKDNKGYEITQMVVTTTMRGAKQTNKEERAQNARTAINDIWERRSQMKRDFKLV